MKLKLLIIIIIFFLSITTLLSLLNTKNKINVSKELHVEGRYIKNETGDTINLRGINQHSFGDFPTGSWIAQDGTISYNTWNPVIVAANLDAMKSWGINTVRMYSCTSFWINNVANHRQIVKDLATMLSDRNMYLIYTFYRNNPSEGQVHSPIPSATFPDEASFTLFWGEVASELKTYPNVIFSIWNEPSDVTYSAAIWLGYEQRCIEAIREAGASNLIIIQYSPGIWFNIAYGPNDDYPVPHDQPSKYGATLWWVQATTLTDPLDNLMYEFHSYRDNLHYNKDTTYYYLWNSTDLSYGYQCVLVDYVLNTLNKPLICGETGANIGLSGKELQRELDYFANELTIFNQWGVNYTSFWWLGRETKYAELLDGPGYQPNQAGQIVINKIAG